MITTNLIEGLCNASCLTVAVDDDQLVLDSVVGFGTSDSLEDERSMSRKQ